MSINKRTWTLPAQSPVIGRQKITDYCKLTLTNNDFRWVCLTGGGGIGKTSLAIQLATECKPNFQDGVCWVSLETVRTVDEVWEKIGEALQLVHHKRSRKEQVCQFLKNRRLLLCLDSTEQVIDFHQVGIEIVSLTSFVKLLVTSRIHQAPRLEKVIPIPPLSLEDSVKLLTRLETLQTSNLATRRYDDTRIKEICKHLDGNPLALVLAASRLVLMGHKEFLENRKQLLSLLTDQSPSIPEKQQSLRKVLEWSINLLTPNQKELLTQLAIFCGSFTIQDVKAICKSEAIDDGLLILMRNSLISWEMDEILEHNRFKLGSLIKEYLTTELDKLNTIQSLQKVHAQYFLDQAKNNLTNVHGPGEPSALHSLKLMHNDLTHARNWTQNSEKYVLAGELSLIIGKSLQLRGSLEGAMAEIDNGLNIISQYPQQSLEAELLLERAGLYLDYKEFDKALGDAEKAEKLFEHVNNQEGIAKSLNLIGQAYVGLKRVSEAFDTYSSALDCFKMIDDYRGQARVKNNVGLMRCNSLSYKSAKIAFQQAINIYTQFDDLRGIARASLNLGYTEYYLQNFQQAIEWYLKALAIELSLGNEYHIAHLYTNIGEAYIKLQNTDNAWRLLSVALLTLRNIGASQEDIAYVSDVLLKLANDDAALLVRWNLAAETDTTILSFLDQII